jgi:hypothetical protein
MLELTGGEFRTAPSYKLLTQGVVSLKRALATLDLGQTPPTTRI